jgi:thioredoxin-related protein
MSLRRYCLLPILVSALLAQASVSHAASEYVFDDKPLTEKIILPEWFKLSYLELHDDLTDAVKAGKRGLIIYFGQPDCAYCKAHLDNNWGRNDIRRYTQKYFDVVDINVRGERLVTGLDGIVATEKKFSANNKTNFTPSLMFIDKDGKTALKLQGYYPPYQFRAALEFVADKHYLNETFHEYLDRAGVAVTEGDSKINSHPAFSRPPYAMDRTRFPGQTPLVVFFEQGRCHACDILHRGPLMKPRINKKLGQLEVVQLDMNSKSLVITPDGQRITARTWSNKLGLFYAPTIIFFDKKGKEIIRVDSVVQLYRLSNVLDYILSGGYRNYSTFQRWRREFKKEK